MTATVRSNVVSLAAWRNPGRARGTPSKDIERPPGRPRIDGAASEAAGLAAGAKLRAQVLNLAQAERHANDGVSLLQTAEDGMSKISGVLARMRGLAARATDSSLGSKDRSVLGEELSAARDEIERLARSTEFDGRPLLDGGVFALRLNAEDDSSGAWTADMRPSALGAPSSLNAVSIATVSAAERAVPVIDQALTQVTAGLSAVFAHESRLTAAVTNLAGSREERSAATPRIQEANLAEEAASRARHDILADAGIAVEAHGNQTPALSLAELL